MYAYYTPPPPFLSMDHRLCPCTPSPSHAPTMAPPLRRYTMHSNTTDQPTNERGEEKRDEETRG